MKGFSLVLVGSVLALLSTSVMALHTEEIEYTANGTTLKGYLAYDDQIKGKRPGILVVHEWWGHNAYVRKRAEMLAALGYTALAVDMYGDGKQAAHPEDAGKFASEVRSNMPVARARFLAAMEVLQKHPTVDNAEVAAIGYCFGGGIVLEMARSGLDLDGVVSFHGSLGTQNPAQSGAVKAKLLVLNGAADPFVKPEQIADFKAEMEAAGVSYTFIDYPNAKHAFTNPEADGFGQKFNLPLAYNAEADAASWQEMRRFFKDLFGK
ncbi:MAG: dienelactone hydrolase [Gammaproteobacteria bacterium SG8_47]|nr:MAG: dienelactone hydrolase [Gammaproteobacteria bacterium SG8_47]